MGAYLISGTVTEILVSRARLTRAERVCESGPRDYVNSNLSKVWDHGKFNLPKVRDHEDKVLTLYTAA